MTEFNDLTDALRNLITQRVQAKIEYVHGLLGDGLGRVKVPGRPDFVFVRPDRFSTRTAEIFNKRVAGPDGTPVIVGELPWEPGLTQVVDIDWETYKNAGPGWGNDFGGVGYHGQGHEWRDGAPGVDTFNVYRRQFGDLKTYSFSSGSTAVNVSSYSFNHLGSMKSWPGSTEFPLADAVPSSTGTARFALVYWSPASGTSGFLGVATGTLGLDAEAEILGRPLTPAGAIPSAYVRLAGGQTSITEFDIYDAREPWQPGIAFGTGNSLIHAGLIPISDTGGFYTGSTVEQALQEAVGGAASRVSQLFTPDLVTEVAAVDAGRDITIATGSVVFLPQLQAVDGSGLKLLEDGGGGILVQDSTADIITAADILAGDTARGRVQAVAHDQELFGDVTDHFLQNAAADPTNWNQVTGANQSVTNNLYSHWFLQGGNAASSWDYNLDTGVDLEVDVGTFFTASFHNFFFRDFGWANDVDYFFGVYGDTGVGAIDTALYSRVQLNWNSAGGNWRVRGQLDDSAGGAVNGAFTTISDPITEPFNLFIRIDNSGGKTSFAAWATFMIETSATAGIFMATQLIGQAQATPPTFGNLYLRINQVRAGGGDRDAIYLGGYAYRSV